MELEKELIGEHTTNTNDERGTGRIKINEGTPFQRAASRMTQQLEIKQGFRRRHPTRVLSQHQGIGETTEKASTQWEEAIMHDIKRVDLPDEYQSTEGTTGMTNQMGLVTTALENYKSSKNKLDRLHLVGV